MSTTLLIGLMPAAASRRCIQAGAADLIEDVARIYGYDRIPATLLADPLPPQTGNADLEREERVRDRLVDLGLQEVITYSLTTPEREAALNPPPAGYVTLVNPISTERSAMRHTVLAGVLEVVAFNLKHTDTVKVFEESADGDSETLDEFQSNPNDPVTGYTIFGVED